MKCLAFYVNYTCLQQIVSWCPQKIKRSHMSTACLQKPRFSSPKTKLGAFFFFSVSLYLCANFLSRLFSHEINRPFFCVRLGSKMRKQFEKSLTSTFSSDLFLSLSSLQFVLPSLPPSKVPIGNFGGFIVVVLRTELRMRPK